MWRTKEPVKEKKEKLSSEPASRNSHEDNFHNKIRDSDRHALLDYSSLYSGISQRSIMLFFSLVQRDSTPHAERYLPHE